MKTNNVTKLLSVLDAGIKPVVRANDNSGGTLSLGYKQLARAVNYMVYHTDENPEYNVWVVNLDFSEFEVYNKSISYRDTYNSETQQSDLHWYEHCSYPKDGKFEYYVAYKSASEFEFVENLRLFELFTLLGANDYVLWLENIAEGYYYGQN